jgi:LysM repeat protein
LQQGYKLLKSLIHIFIIAVLFLGLAGCGLKSSDESSHPLFKRAVKAQKSNELGLAIGYFNRYLSLRPDSSITHLRLAAIYDENLDKQLHAVYHYERFLELTPKSSEAESVKKWQEAALKKYYYKTRQKLNDPEDIGVLQNSLFLTKQELGKNKTKLKKIKLLQKKLILFARKTRNNERILKAKLSNLQAIHQKTLDEIKKERNKIKEESALAEEEKITAVEDKEEEDKITNPEKKEEKEEEPKEKVKVKEKSTAVKLIPKAATAAPPFEIKKIDKTETQIDKIEIKIDKTEIKPDIKERTYTVKKGDSLSNISRKFYGSSKYYKLIFEANRGIIPSEKALRPGQILKIPQR